MRRTGGAYDAAQKQDHRTDDPRTTTAPTVVGAGNQHGERGEGPGEHRHGSDDGELRRLLPAAADGDERALDAFLRVLQPHVVRYCRSRLGGQSGHAVEEVAQDVLMAVCDALPRFQPSGAAVLAFVFGIAKHKIADSYRAASRNRSTPSESIPDSVDPGVGPEHTAIQAMESLRVRELLAAMPDSYREVLILRIAMGWSANEVAAHIGSTPGAVRVTQHRAMARLRELLARDSGPD